MTPAIDLLRCNGVDFELLEYTHDANIAAYGEEAAQALGLPPDAVFKTLIVNVDGKHLAVALVPVSKTLDLKALARAAKGKKAVLAEAAVAERATGYVVGGISPLGQKQRLTTFIDSSAEQLECLYVSAGRRGLEIALSPEKLQQLTQARMVPLARN
ncbi:Cys-tRNA(Pro) deacylase [Halomonas sp. PR-M31]|uniref:Cys-tRNA(Pro) deacylase n=1 Tax=Halomonas sp. PR-M31 TaxID=1471202 RepID=UPI00065187C8|nr:Cys-tRNA(Pro) deacylase [Halomonas sp. PR-M31]